MSILLYSEYRAHAPTCTCLRPPKKEIKRYIPLRTAAGHHAAHTLDCIASPAGAAEGAAPEDAVSLSSSASARRHGRRATACAAGRRSSRNRTARRRTDCRARSGQSPSALHVHQTQQQHCKVTLQCSSQEPQLSPRETARCVLSVEILPIATQQCRNYL